MLRGASALPITVDRSDFGPAYVALILDSKCWMLPAPEIADYR